MGADKRVSRTERSGRYGSEQSRDDERRDRRDRDDRGYDSHRWSDDRRSDRYDGERSDRADRYWSRDSPEQRGRKRRSSDGSDDGHHSDGDYSEHDYRGDPADEKESKTIMLRGLPMNTSEADIRAAIEQLEGPKPMDVRLMKKRTGETDVPRILPLPNKPVSTGPTCFCLNTFCHSNMLSDQFYPFRLLRLKKKKMFAH
ncbi:hypothetical protein cypCar_00007447 [Cyprinus carpio]|nr:hypothetical protein cypCar_00007447 [Cyprinus carpio]